jgi:predicted acyl esterase
VADDAQPLIPGEPAELSFGLFPTSVLFRRGHRIRVAIAGHDDGNFRRYPAVGDPTIRLHRDRTLTSFVRLPVRRRK